MTSGGTGGMRRAAWRVKGPASTEENNVDVKRKGRLKTKGFDGSRCDARAVQLSQRRPSGVTMGKRET